MATPGFIGNATPTYDTWTGTVANTWATGDTATITHTSSGKTLVVTIGANVTTAQVATTIKQAFQSETFTDTTASCVPAGGGTVIPEFAEWTASVSGSVVTITADTAGVSIGSLSMSETTAGSGTFTGSHSVTASGPNWFTNTTNWSTGSVPVSTDDVTFDRPVSLFEGLAQSAITLASQTFTERFTTAAKVGLPRRNAGGFEEYRDTELALSATTWTNRSSSSLIKQNFGSVQTTANNYSSGTSAETGRPAVQLRGTHASNVLNVYGGDVGWGANNETATLATCRQEGGTLHIGSGTSLTTLNKLAGYANVYCAATTVTNVAGTLNHHSGNITTLNIFGGTVTESGSGTLSTINMTGGTLTTSSTSTATTINISGGSAVLYGTVGTVVAEAGASVTIDSGNTTSITATNSTIRYNGSGTNTAITLTDSDIYFDGGSAACTVTNITLNGTSRIFDKANRVVFTNGPTWQGVLRVSPT